MRGDEQYVKLSSQKQYVSFLPKDGGSQCALVQTIIFDATANLDVQLSIKEVILYQWIGVKNCTDESLSAMFSIVLRCEVLSEDVFYNGNQ